jgi:NADPH:quinone reductase-like Zn-dependent oxidoreductase
MKAIVCTKYGPPDVLQLQEVEKPAPSDNEVLIRIYATAVTSSDCIIRGFKVPLALRLPMGLVIGFTKPRKAILGMVLAGEVVLPLSMVDNSVFSLNCLTLPIDPAYPSC